MEVPTEAVNTLSDTTWGAILVLTVFVMCGFITYLMFQTRTLNRTIKHIADQRAKDAREMYEDSQKMVRESMETVGKATAAIQDLGNKISELTNVILRWQSGGGR